MNGLGTTDIYVWVLPRERRWNMHMHLLILAQTVGSSWVGIGNTDICICFIDAAPITVPPLLRDMCLLRL